MLWAMAVLLLGGLLPAGLRASPAPLGLKLVFVHHSCGENWLADDNGGLGAALAKAGYFVSDTNYGWGPNGIGDRTDIPNWPEWFCGPDAAGILTALLAESETHSPYRRTLPDPGGPNRVVMFKSCFPNSELGGKPDDPPNGDGDLTVGGAKGVYLQLRKAFLARPETFFVVVTAPPVSSRRQAKNARAFNTWLARDWLKGYPGKNVAVFDFYNILTGKDNHHRLVGGQEEYANDRGGNTLAYPSDDDHPSADGNRKATAEFVPWLDHHVRRWLATSPPERPPAAKATESDGAVAVPPSRASAVPPPRTAGPDPVEDPSPMAITDGEDGSANFAALDGWEVFQDESVSAPMMGIIRKGKDGILAVAYRVKGGAWAACAKVLPSVVDWRAHAGVSVRYLAPADCRPILTVYENGPDNGLLHFECPLPAGNGQWRDATVTWAQFRQPEWQGDVNQPFRPERARGVAVILHPEAAAIQGELRLAKVKLMP